MRTSDRAQPFLPYSQVAADPTAWLRSLVASGNEREHRCLALLPAGWPRGQAGTCTDAGKWDGKGWEGI